MCIPIAVKKLWGERPNSIYAAGYAGGIAHFDGVSWQALSSGTTLPIQDVWGGVNPRTGETEILAVASDPFTAPDRKILSVRGITVTALSDNGISTALGGVWFSSGSSYYVTGGSAFRKSNPGEATWTDALRSQGINVQYLDAIRGTAPNDVFAAGANGDVLHFNGGSWRNYRPQTGLTYGEYHAIAVNGDLVVAVGEDVGLGVVAIGRRTR
ncbi:MAG: hypothetical protein AB1428_04960 [Bacteroidota bacterium]